MKKWVPLEWLKKLSVLLLIFLNFWIILKLLPYIGHALGYVLAILAPFLIAILIAYLLHPLINKLHRQGLPRTLAILIIYILFFGLATYAGIKGTPIVIKELKSFAKHVPELTDLYRDNVNNFYYATSDLPETVHDHFDTVVASIEHGLNKMVENIIVHIKGLLKSLFSILLIPFVVFYLLKDWDRVKAWLYKHTPPKWRNSAKTLVFDIDESLGGYIRGQLLVCAIVGIVSILGLWLFHIPYSLLLGLFIGITDIIPYFGPIIGAVPAILIAVTLSVNKVIFVVLLVVIVQFLEGNVISPLIVGKSVHIHPIFIMLSLVIGGDIAGILGMLIAVPVFVILRVFVNHYTQYREHIDKHDDSHL